MKPRNKSERKIRLHRKNEPKRTVTILLTKYSDLFGRFISGISSDGYTHASISIDGKEEIFYSFNYKGFVIEKPKKVAPKTRRPESICIRLQVTEKTYRDIEKELNRFLQNREQYTYSKWGVVLCLLRIPHKFENQYFCSQFVAEVLSHSGAIQLKKQPSLYLPSQLIDGFYHLPTQKQIVYNIL